MRKIIVLSALLCISLSILSAEDGVTFQVEELSKPTELLKEYTFRDAYDLILYSMGSIDYSKRAEQSDYNNILYHSVGDRSLVLNDDNPFFNGMREAYANHRPVVLSPDMIWLLISQGFSHHVNFNSEQLKDKIVKPDIDTDITAYIVEEHKDKDLSEIDWIDVISQFADGIAEKTKNNFKSTQIVCLDIDNGNKPFREFISQLTYQPTISYTPSIVIIITFIILRVSSHCPTDSGDYCIIASTYYGNIIISHPVNCGFLLFSMTTNIFNLIVCNINLI